MVTLCSVRKFFHAYFFLIIITSFVWKFPLRDPLHRHCKVHALACGHNKTRKKNNNVDIIHYTCRQKQKGCKNTISRRLCSWAYHMVPPVYVTLRINICKELFRLKTSILAFIFFEI